MICLICRETGIFEGLTSILFQRGEMHLVVNKVPARVCLHCGEAYVEETVTVLLLQSMEKIYQAGIAARAIDYERLLAE